MRTLQLSFRFLILFITLSLAFSNIADAQLISRWRFETDGSDTQGITDFTFVGATIGTSNSPEGSGYLYLDGQIYAQTNLGFPGSEFTITGWVYGGSDNNRTIMSNKGYSANADGILIQAVPNQGKIVVNTGNGSTALTVEGQSSSFGAYSWAHFAVVINRAGSSCDIYINGVKTTTGSILSDFNVSSTVVRLGQTTDGQQLMWGRLDDIHLYGCSLSGTEIGETMNGSVGDCGTTPVTYTLNVTAGTGGSVSAVSGTYNAGTQVQISATANSGYIFSGWSGSLTGTTNPTTVTMNANKTITANFQAESDDTGIEQIDPLLFKNGGSWDDYTRPQIALGWYYNQKYAHRISTRHYSNDDEYNAIDFYLWNTSQDPDDLGDLRMMSITTQGVGIGVANPSSKLEVAGTIHSTSGGFKLPDGTIIDDQSDLGSGGTSFWSQSGQSISYDGSVGIGTINPGIYKLAVEGTIGAREVKITLDNWADFVFEDDYNLRSLSEIEEFIRNNKHLPDVPSEEMVKEEGVAIGEMNAILLQKIEELTLHMIEQEKLIKQLQSKVDQLEKTE